MRSISALVVLVCLALPSTALAWSDTAISWRVGSQFAEPYRSTDIGKHIFGLTHISDYGNGSHFVNLDYLMSDSRDPAQGSVSGAREAYLLYRYKLDLGKTLAVPPQAGAARSFGITAGFDINHKNDTYASRKRMLVLGPTLMLDVPGFLDISLLMLWESNRPAAMSQRYHYKPHPMLNLVWGVPLGGGTYPAKFEGYANLIASKGQNEFGGASASEINLDTKLMFDVGNALGVPSSRLRAGIAYQFWRNKFGNPSSVPGSRATTWMLRTEAHF